MDEGRRAMEQHVLLDYAQQMCPTASTYTPSRHSSRHELKPSGHTISPGAAHGQPAFGRLQSRAGGSVPGSGGVCMQGPSANADHTPSQHWKLGAPHCTVPSHVHGAVPEAADVVGTSHVNASGVLAESLDALAESLGGLVASRALPPSR